MASKKTDAAPRNAQATRARILAAAQEAFSTKGYAAAGIRDISALAGVNSSLVSRYFGSKLGLFEAALTDAMQSADLFGHPRESIGQHLAEQLARTDIDVQPPVIIALATSDPEANATAVRVARDRALAPLAQWLGGDDAMARATQIFMLAMSFALYTRQVPVTTMTGPEGRAMRDWFSASVQAVVDGSA